MTTRTVARRLVVVIAVLTVALSGIALPAAAKGGPKSGKHSTTQVVETKGKGKAAAAKAAKAAKIEKAQARKAAAKARKAARFVAVGSVTAVEGTQVQVAVKGGKKALRKLSREAGSVTFTVDESTRIKRDGELVDVSAIQVGDHVVVKGASTGEGEALVYLAKKLFAQSPDEEEAAEDETDDVTGDDTGDDVGDDVDDDTGDDVDDDVDDDTGDDVDDDGDDDTGDDATV